MPTNTEATERQIVIDCEMVIEYEKLSPFQRAYLDWAKCDKYYMRQDLWAKYIEQRKMLEH